MKLLQHKFDQEQNARLVKKGLLPPEEAKVEPKKSAPVAASAPAQKVVAKETPAKEQAAVSAAPATPVLEGAGNGSASAGAKVKTKKKGSLMKFHFSPFTIIVFIILMIYVISLLSMIGWGLLSSFKANEDFRINKFGLPKQWVWNYTYVFKQFFASISVNGKQVKIYMPELFFNAFVYSLGCSLTSAFVPLLTAYLVAKFDFKFGKVIYTIVIITMILPIVGSLPSELMFAKFFGLYDQLWGLWIMRGHFLGMNFLIYHAMFKALPNGYAEAARIDGAGNMTIFLRIMLPFARNLFFTIVLMNFIGFWNDYQTPLVWMPSHPTIAFGMYQMTASTNNSLAQPPRKMTAAMLMLIPILILFAAFQKKLLGNLTIGGLKG